MTDTAAWWAPFLYLALFAALLTGCYLAGRAFHRYVGRRIASEVRNALDHGDEQIALAVAEMDEVAARRRARAIRQHPSYTVPRQFTNRSHNR